MLTQFDPTDFFFLRPLWLLLLVPALALVVLALRRRATGDTSAWRGLVDPHLLQVLAVGGRKSAPRRWPAALLALGLVAAIVAMAGPTWQKIEVPSYQTKDPAVVALSLAQSMNADDVRPTRLARAGHKVRDILERMDGGDTGFVIYADRPFTAAPLTEDGEVIREMLPELSTALMPVLGNRADRAIAQATTLLENAGAAAGRIVLIADGPGNDLAATLAAAEAARAAGYEVDVLGVGKDADAALKTASGRAITNGDGSAMTAGFDPEGLAAIAAAGGGAYVPLQAGNGDVARLIPTDLPDAPQSGLKANDLKADGWADMGYWLLIIPVLLAPFAFRRNVLMGLAVLVMAGGALGPREASAAELKDLWQTPDQQAADAFEVAEYGDAATLFEDPAWRASALYRAGDYAGAASTLSSLESADAAYNRGNALAKSGDLEAALAAYDASLAIRPDDEDTRFNRDLVEKLLEKQKEQEQQQDQQQQSDQNDQQQQDQQQSGEEGEQQQDQQQAGQDGEQQQDQQQAGQDGEQQQQDQEQAGQDGEQQQDQEQAGQEGEAQQDQEQAGQDGEQQQDQEQAGREGEPQQDQQQADRSGEAQREEMRDQAEAADEKAGEETEAARPDDDAEDRNAFQRAMDAFLDGNGAEEAPEEEPQAAASAPMTEREQSIEQLLRRVPDDATGLLRARIQQHYRRSN
ncbi:MAG: hypothetical protein AcusKO_01930 [Acuticoccus sp.]